MGTAPKSKSFPVLALVGLCLSLSLFVILGWGYGGPTEVQWREAAHLEVVGSDGWGAERGMGFAHSSPTYHALLRGWLRMGSSVEAARRLSFGLGLLLVVAVWAAGLRLFGAAEGVAASLLVAVNPLVYYHTHLVSPQPVFWTLGAGSVAAWYVFLREGRAPRWVFYVAGTLLAVYAGPAGLALVGVQVAMAIWWIVAPTRRDHPARKPILEIVTASVVLVALSVPRIIMGAGSPGPPMASGQKVTGITLGLLDSAYRDLAGGGGFAGIAVGVAALLGLVTSVRKRVVRSRGIGRVYVDKRRRRPALCLFWIVLTSLLVASLFTVPLTRSLQADHLHGVLPFLLLLSARGIVELASLLRSLFRSLFGFRLPSPAAAWLLALALLLPASLGSARRIRVEGASATGWQHVGERLGECLALGGTPLVIPKEARAALRWNTPSLELSPPADPTPATIGPGTVCLVAAVAGLPPPSDEMQEACDKRLQEVDRYLFPNRKGFFTLRASPGLASVARRALGALDVLHNDPSSTSALRDLALAYLDRGHLGEALSTLRRVADSGQASALDLLQLALVEEQLGRRSAALSHYRATVAQQGDLALAHTRMGVLLATQGEFNQSRVHLEESLRLVPSDREALEALHSVALKQGDSSSAAQAAGRLQELAPAITTGGGFAGRFALIGYTLSDTLAGHGEPVVIEYYLQCSRPAPGGHTLRHRILGTGMGMSHQTVDTADSSSLANALPGETVVVRCELGIQWNPLGGNGQLQLGLASRDGGLLPTTNAVGAWLPVVGLAVSTGQAAEPVAVVQASEMTRETGFMMGDGLSVSPKGAWTEFHPGDGRWRLVAVVRGVPAGGEWPIMSLEVNGQEKLKSPVEGKGWLEQTCSLGPGPIRARVALKLLNDYYNAATGEDRNLVVRELRLVEETHFLAVTPLR